ncbi:Asp-tRNA(Asn)/Glu-tRNA(Gln) amidotransferase A subunit family amidase [Stella humosa]|uniref:Asp-tRNA(Asn)/Glu-tRNA(Gln) amidotransferase A subunit family amidase n=1 Tax=Stella humosa TaxID=94 RepID=A0A3N1KSR3_9PROT|nr:amidase [Stella humosa]ROP81156.1 Asp-tRNA(Asn)/Glu-tRNA(Gln) amidotransferase A subunit family amidase [Stella humosa]BBK32501.1 amidase [Stella humosa]
MDASGIAYDPRSTTLLTFQDQVARFRDGSDSPRAYLERCLETHDVREAEVRAFVVINREGARRAADAATVRYAAGRPLGPLDGMPLGVKDLYETEDMPTGMGSPIYAGWESHRDAASVYALRRQAGVVVLGKTTTTEFGFSHPGPTTNPFDPARTPGGSSSGSAAAVGARMVPVAFGSQLMGSVIRPASYCGNWGYKPTYGALNRGGGHSSLSQSHLGLHAGSLADAWAVAFETSRLAGGDPGYPGIYGAGAMLPPAQRPRVLARLDGPGWAIADAAAQAALDDYVDRLRAAGVTVLSRADHPGVAALEEALLPCSENSMTIIGWELKWPLAAYREKGEGLLSQSIADRLEGWEKITIEEYRRAVEIRNEMRRRLAALRPAIEGFVGLPAPGVAPIGLASTGNPICNVPSSTLGAPVFTVPLLALDGMPLGVQIMGYPDGDEATCAIARWMGETAI